MVHPSMAMVITYWICFRFIIRLLLFFFQTEDTDGKIIRCGLHGGIGLNTLTDEYLEKSGLPKSLRKEFVRGLEMLRHMPVDLCLPSHTNQYKILTLVPEIREGHNPFVNPRIWGELMEARITEAGRL